MTLFLQKSDKIITVKFIKNYELHNLIVIRNNDPDGIIICPTPQGGHEPKNASGDLVNATNIMYTLHYYAGSDNIVRSFVFCISKEFERFKRLNFIF